MNLITLALAETPREILIDGTCYVLVRKAALDALYPSAAGDRATRSPAARAASPATSRPAPKKLKAPPSRSPVARPAAAPKPEASKPESGALRAAVLAAINANPGETSLELWDRIKQQIPTTPSGSCYTAIKSWVAKGVVEGRSTEAGPKGWYPVHSARKAASSNTGTPKGQAPLPNAPAIHPAPQGSAEARGAA